MSLTGVAQSAVRAAVRPYEHLTTTPPESLERYIRDPWAHADDGHIVIPDLVTMEEVVYTPWPHQREFAEHWIDFERLAATGELAFFNVHEEKSRQMGMTWTIAYLVWWITTHHEAPGGYQHVDIQEVDDGGRNNTVKSFFGRVRYVNDHVPERWRSPLRFRGGNAPTIRHAYRPRAFVLGEGATGDPARGQRLKWFVQDEGSRLPFDKAATAALARACPVGRVMNSTPKGEDNEYFRVRDERPKGWRFLHHHWSIHPVYGAGQHIAGRSRTCQLCRGNRLGLAWTPGDPVCHRYPGKLTSPWYDEAVLELTDDQVAMELDINYAGSLTARVYPEFDETTHALDAAQLAERGVDPQQPYEEALPLELSWDYGIDTTAVGIWQDARDEYRKIGEVEMHDATPEMVVDELLDTLANLGVPLVLLEPEWTLQLLAVGDPAGEAREKSTGRPLTADYRRLGFYIRSRRRRIHQTVNAMKRLLQGTPKPLVVYGPTCPLTVKHFKGNTWPVDRKGKRLPAPEPKNDEHNHMMRADAYLVTWKFPPASEDDTDAVAEAAARAARRLPGDEIGPRDPELPDRTWVGEYEGGMGIGYDTKG